MIDILVSENFKNIGHQWRTTAGMIQPSEEDVQKVLDHAAKVLYDEEVGTRLSVGGLIIEKSDHGHDVYVYVGNYQ